jgi:hypothetical protein
VCSSRGGYGGSSSSSGGGGITCTYKPLQSLTAWDETLEGVFTAVVGGLVLLALGFGAGAGWAWRGAPVLDKRQHKRMEEYRAAAQRGKKEADMMWEEFFAQIAEAGDR